MNPRDTGREAAGHCRGFAAGRAGSAIAGPPRGPEQRGSETDNSEQEIPEIL
jgi:hypothetical protein